MGKSKKANNSTKSGEESSASSSAVAHAAAAVAAPQSSPAIDDIDKVSRSDGAKKGSSNNVKNPLLTKQAKFLSSIPRKVKKHFFSEEHVDAETRAEIWTKQADLGEELVNNYAWATFDERALKILQNFSPIVEIGCGSNGYWSKAMHQRGIDVVAYDIATDNGGKISTTSGKKRKKGKKRKCDDEIAGDLPPLSIRHGGPEVLATDPISKSRRNLFLCYPDEEDFLEGNQSMGAQCLEHFQGRIVIIVGELSGDTLSMDQAPWGRSFAPEFQQRLAAEYHCLLKASLPRWLHVNDTISVWKRSETCSIVFEGDEEGYESDEEIEYKYIPPNEVLPQDVAAPCLKHLLEK